MRFQGLRPWAIGEENRGESPWRAEPISTRAHNPTSRSRKPRRCVRSARSPPSSAFPTTRCLPTAATRRKSRSTTSTHCKDRPNGKLILVTAITPTPAGEGKTTTTVGLGDALNHIGKKAIICLREPSLGPSFGDEGRRRRRRLRPGRADGGHQPPFHRRFPRDRRRQQPARGDGRQPHLLGQRARHRLAPGHLAPRPRHERPGAALRSPRRSAASPTVSRARMGSTSSSPPR